MIAALVLALLAASPASAQFQCTGDVCYSEPGACEGRRSHLRDEGARAPECRAATRVHCVEADDVIGRERALWCSTTPSACRARIREIQGINRAARRHLYEDIGECTAIESDPDHDGVHLGLDLCPLDRGVASADGCPDGDGDGTTDRVDRCPDVAGPLSGCPDADGDSFPDDMDSCPAEPGVEWRQGCPPIDADGDGVEDEGDRCPTVAGEPATGGCPDGDRDGVIDAADVCPATVGTAMTWGCPDADRDRVPDACFDTARALTMAPTYPSDEVTFRMFRALNSSSCEAGWYSDRCRDRAEDYLGGTRMDPVSMDGCPQRR